MLRLSGTMRLGGNYATSCRKPHNSKFQSSSGFFPCLLPLLSDAVARAAWDRRRDDRRFRHDRLKRWLCDGDGASGGVYKSLLTTAAGLVVATPTFVAYSYLSSRVNTMMHDMERAGIEIVHMLTESRPISGIISFQQPDETVREIEARQDL
jgi:Biopolymer transport proteins